MGRSRRYNRGMATVQHDPAALDRVRAHAAAIREVVSRHGAGNPRIFGSVARGDAREGSDVDFLVDPNPSLSLLGLVRMERELADLLGTSVDVVVDDEVPARAKARVFGEAVVL